MVTVGQKVALLVGDAAGELKHINDVGPGLDLMVFVWYWIWDYSDLLEKICSDFYTDPGSDLTRVCLSFSVFL